MRRGSLEFRTGPDVTILILLIPLSILLMGIAIAAFVWAARHDQFEDLEAEGSRILFDEEPSEGTRAREDRRRETKP